jgi:hypothetical protein
MGALRRSAPRSLAQMRARRSSLCDLVFKRGDAALLLFGLAREGVVFRGQCREHGFDVRLPSAEWGKGELIRRERVSGAARDEASAGPAADRGR